MICIDTSFLVPIYLEEKNSSFANEYLRELRKPIHVTSWNEIELLTAFSLNVHFGRISEFQRKKAIHQWELDLRSGFFISTSLSEEKVLIHSKKIIHRHPTIPARSLDILHVSAALSLKARVFLTFDKRQSELARKNGLKVFGTAALF